jgi:uncharacterized protein YkwD
MPRTPAQGLGFVLGFWLALWLSPFRAARADDFAALEAALQQRVAEVRAEHRLIPLERVPELDRVARAHAQDMARRGYLSHETPEGANPVDRLGLAGVSGFSLAAENIGLTSRGRPAQEVVAHWLTSVEHRRALLTPAFNHTGIGAARSADGSLIFTQLYVTYPRN